VNSVARRERERGELRERILDATRQLLVEGGKEAVTMREVARRVEYSPAALYQHFPDKESLIRALCLADFGAFAALFLALPTHGGPLCQLCRAGFAYLEFARTHPEHYRFMFLTPDAGSAPETEEERSDPAQNAYVFLHALVVRAMEAGVIAPEFDDAHLLAQTVWAQVHGVAALDVCRRGADAWVDFRQFELRAAAVVRSCVLAMARDRELALAAFELVESEVRRG
jgi:AcrR family transcriptional regulator